MPDKQYGIGAVGEAEVIGAFRAIGMKAVAADSEKSVAQAVHKLVAEGVRVIFITEAAARAGAETFERYKTDPEVTLIPIPGSGGFHQTRLAAGPVSEQDNPINASFVFALLPNHSTFFQKMQPPIDIFPGRK